MGKTRKRRPEWDEDETALERLAKLARGVKPKQKGGFHTPRKQAENRKAQRHHERQELKEWTKRPR